MTYLRSSLQSGESKKVQLSRGVRFERHFFFYEDTKILVSSYVEVISDAIC